MAWQVPHNKELGANQMSEQENLMPLVGSVMPSQPEPVLAVESEPVKAEPKKEKKEPVLKSEGNKII